MTVLNLFEYQNKESFNDTDKCLQTFLDEIWQRRETSDFWSDGESKVIEAQRFLQFLHKTDEIKSNKYVGVIHFNDQKINLLPKIFFDSTKGYTKDNVQIIHYHIMWWLSYCRKIKFPNYNTSLGCVKGDLFEVLIYLFAKYTRNLLNSSIYQQYEEISNELTFVKGRINTSTYINENIAKGRWHKINCTYDLFTHDNKFNRIIKYVAILLFNNTVNSENKKMLRDILFILDEVTLERVTAAECKKIQFNPMFTDFETVRDYCYLFLNNSISYSYKNDLNLFAFLIPMEYLFEDFICGFIEREIKNISVTAKSNSKYLDENKDFNICPDLVLSTGKDKIIADTKYKIIYSGNNDPKNGITQSDLYQMLAYAVRFDIRQIMLFYPDTIKGYQDNEFRIIVKDELAKGMEVVMKAYQLPIINRRLFEQNCERNEELNLLFKETKDELIKRISIILL